MAMYDRSQPMSYRLIDRFDDGVGWLAHPDETGRRASHAIRGEEGDVWLFDPLDAPGIDAEIRALGNVAGIVVCSAYHTRDAAAFSRRFDVPVFVPSWLDRIPAHLPEDVPIEAVDDEIGTSGFRLRKASPFPGWTEGIAYRRSDATMYVPDLLGTAPPYLAGDERLAIYLLVRPVPPTDAFAGLAPKRILVGHGQGISPDAAAALAGALEQARRGFPRAALVNGQTQLRALVDAL